METDEYGFIKPTEVGGDMIATNRPGIFAAGCATGPKDIPDSVTEAGAAAAYALTYTKQKTWPLKLEVEPIDISGPPNVGVFICHCGSNIAGTVDVEDVVAYARGVPGVGHSENIRFACAGNALEHITNTIKEKKLTRVVVGACSPKTHGPTFQQSCAKAGLNPYLFEMANIRNQDSWVHKKEPEAATEKARDLVRMAVDKSAFLKPLQPTEFPVVQKALVVGGGVAGMTAAANLARQGFETHLVEHSKELGGVLRYLDEVAPSGLNAKELLAAKIKDLHDAGVNVHVGSEIENVSGFVGNFNAHLSSGENLDVGTIILATGAEVYQPSEFGYGSNTNILTTLELEGKLPKVDANRITFVACVGSRSKERGCSRFCCETMISQALRLKNEGKKVRVLYRDIRTFNRNAEELYEEACRKGIQFFQFDQDQPLEEAIRFENGNVLFHDELVGSDVSIPTDLLVLNIGLTPYKEGVGVANQLKVSRDTEGFLLESHPKLGPVEAAVGGVFLCGTSQGPKNVRESVAQALATASKAATILSRKSVEREPVAAVVDYDKCTFCQRCVAVCPYSAIRGELKKSLEI
ncbi:MAG: FAD-dependent oxidoreductase, partial [Candidatus Bathyarchaeia archaeon]